MWTLLGNAYIFIGILLVIVVMAQSKTGLRKKLAITLIFALTVLCIERPYWLQLWAWKIRSFLGV